MRRGMLSRKVNIRAGLVYTYPSTQSHPIHAMRLLLVGEATGQEYEVRGSTVL